MLCSIFWNKKHLSIVRPRYNTTLPLNNEGFTHFIDQGGWSSLTIACGDGRAEIVAELLKHGADTELCIHEVI